VKALIHSGSKHTTCSNKWKFESICEVRMNSSKDRSGGVALILDFGLTRVVPDARFFTRPLNPKSES
jgi:hypothetical protein